MRPAQKKRDKEYTLSAGAIAVRREKILLVRHGAVSHGRSFLVAPGGGVESDESFPQAAVRELKEETGLDASPNRVLFIEDMVSRRKRVLKVWFLCNVVGGRLLKTQSAAEDGIVEAGWYRKAQLEDEVVYPSILVNIDWRMFFKDTWETIYLENRDLDAEF